MKIVNICGFPRSGTTFLASLLHSKVGFFALPECQFRFPESIFTTNNLFDRFRHSNRVKKSFLSWNELAKFNLVRERPVNKRFTALQSSSEFLKISFDFCTHYYPEFSADFIIDHTPENLFGFDNNSDFSSQYFIFLRRSLTDIAQSHRRVNWSNQPISLLSSRYCIYNTYCDNLCSFLSTIGLADHFVKLNYTDLLSSSIDQIVYETGSQSLFHKALLREQKHCTPLIDFPLPSYTHYQHAFIGQDISQSKLKIETNDENRFFYQMRHAYHSLTLFQLLKNYLHF